MEFLFGALGVLFILYLLTQFVNNLTNKKSYKKEASYLAKKDAEFDKVCKKYNLSDSERHLVVQRQVNNLETLDTSIEVVRSKS